MSEEIFHRTPIIVNVGGNRQLNPISFRRSSGSELYHNIVAGKERKPSSLVSSALFVPRESRTDAEQLSPAGLLR